MARRRNAILSAVEMFRELDSGMTLNNLIVFLYVAENQGLSVTELATVSGFSTPTASRCVRSLARPGSRWALPPALDLVSVCNEGPAKNSKTLRLTEKGLALCARLERCIADGAPIAADPWEALWTHGAPRRLEAVRC